MQKVTVPNEILLGEVGRLIEKGDKVTLLTKGSSMLPFIKGEKDSDDFYGRLLHHMTLQSDGKVEVSLNLLPARWYFVLDGLAEYEAQKVVQNASTVPISVSKAFNSG